jgi:SAM-dependent methyltransferase
VRDSGVTHTDDDHYAVNRTWWDERAPAHTSSPDYAVQEIIADPTRLSAVVRFDVPRLGDIKGQRGIHLQCHIGTDTISLHRLGAAMTGLDFSSESIAVARCIAADTHADVTFVHADVYSAPVAVGGGFDFVFTGIGALGWLPDVARWARTVADLLRPGGRLFLREGHPMMLAFDEERMDALVLGYSYFEQPEPGHFDLPGTYVKTQSSLTTTSSGSGATAWETSSPRSWRQAWSSPCSSSTTRCRGTRFPAACVGTTVNGDSSSTRSGSR